MKDQTIKITLTFTLLGVALLNQPSQAGEDFDHYDKNHNGSICFTEYSNKQYAAKYQGKAPDCAKNLCDVGFGKFVWNQFAAKDSNKNGSLTRSEFGGYPTSNSSAGSSPKAPASAGSSPKAPTSASSAPKAPTSTSSAPKPPASSAPKTTPAPAPTPTGSAPK